MVLERESVQGAQRFAAGDGRGGATLNADCTVLISKIRCRGCIILFQRKVYNYRH